MGPWSRSMLVCRTVVEKHGSSCQPAHGYLGPRTLHRILLCPAPQAHLAKVAPATTRKPIVVQTRSYSASKWPKPIRHGLKPLWIGASKLRLLQVMRQILGMKSPNTHALCQLFAVFEFKYAKQRPKPHVRSAYGKLKPKWWFSIRSLESLLFWGQTPRV